MSYFSEVYSTFYLTFMWGWLAYVVGGIIAIFWIKDLDNADPYKGQKRYYGIIALVALLIIGLVGTIFLPSRELVTAWLS